jgi:RHS repeat-associated protein
MGSVMTATNEYGTLEERYEYDAFGQPYTGDLTSGMYLGYTGKPYDTTTGLYNYGYRDYKPEAARFTTIDPIRDGANWFAYVNNDPVNWVDLWGLIPLTPDQRQFAETVIGTSYKGNSINYDAIDIITGVVPEQVIKDTMANAGVPMQAGDDKVINDMQDPSRGTSIPGGTIYLPGTTSQDNARVTHEIFHQVQYNDLGITTAVQQFTVEQRKFSAGINVYDYTINNTGIITTLNNITTLEAAANYVEDFANSYTTDKSNGSYSARTKEMAGVLQRSGLDSKAIRDIKGR